MVTLDADGQHDPFEIPNVVEPIVKGVADVVIGSRFVDPSSSVEMPRYRRWGAKLITKLVNGSSKNGIKDAQSGFRAYNRKALGVLDLAESGMGASVEILLKGSKNGLRICEVPGSCKYNNGEVDNSTVHPFRHGVGVMTSIIRLVVEERPLVFLGIPGILSLAAGIFFGIWMLQIYAVEHRIVTNIALASLSFVVIGFFLLSTAITLYAISRLKRRVDNRKI